MLETRDPRGQYRSPEYNKYFRFKFDLLSKSDTMTTSPIDPFNLYFLFVRDCNKYNKYNKLIIMQGRQYIHNVDISIYDNAT